MSLPYRSLIFVPAHDAERLEQAYASGADAVVADLEDAVPADRKQEARDLLPQLLPTLRGAARLVRVNEVGSADFATDLAVIETLPLDAVVLPKATAAAVASLNSSLPVVAVIETARGLHEAFEVASAPAVAVLELGAADLSADLRLTPLPEAAELLYARSKLVAESAAAGIRAPVDRVYPRFDDPDGLEADAAYARALGFGGKGCTHPAQPAVVNAVFGAPAYDAGAAKAAIYER
jgi:citrate lyase subunit beta/citryl-CoA lyase